MSEGERYGVGLSISALEKRNQQLVAWESSETNREPSYLLPRLSKTRVKFSKDIMFLAAVTSSDEEEVERLLKEEGANVNCQNSDGLTAIHQCCIDDDLNMLKLVVKHGGNVNGTDHEGWTPLHAATSCGYAHIVKYLLECGAFPASVNNEGQTPVDLAEDYDDIIEMLQVEIDRLGLDVEDVKCEEERRMLEDAKKLRNNPNLEPVMSPGGATPLHVAAAKNYTTVLNVLLSIKGLDINAIDDDGWTPLHAAVHWESMEAAELLIFNGANIYAKTYAGEELDDLVDPELEDELQQLKKLNSYINPEQDQVRKRRHQVGRRNSNTVTHQNSIDNKYPNPGLVKRRLSKEKLTIPTKMIDMKKEKDLMQSFEKLEEEGSSEHNSNNTNSWTSLPSSDPSTTDLPYSSSSSNTVDSTTSNNNKGSSTPPMVRTDSFTGSGSPKNSRRKTEMSRQMLDRLNVFESSKSGGVVGGGPSSPNVSSPRTSTPINSPFAFSNGSSERKRVESTDVHRPRVSSLDPTSSTAQRQSDHKNRFPFQPKSISGIGKSMSLDRGERPNYKDVEKNASINSTPTSSGSHISRTVVESKTNETVTATPDVLTSPTSSTPSQSDISGNMSTDSRDRSSSSIGQPETKRKSAAKKHREQRRSTQPVPTDLLERISRHDTLEEHQLEQQTSGMNLETKSSAENTVNKEIPPQNHQSAYNPPTRPSSKLVSQNSFDSTPIFVTTSEPEKVPNNAKQSTGDGDGANDSSTYLSPQIPRAKSATRRKPKEKRRSTGIPTEVEDDSQIPDNLKGIIHIRSESGDSNDSSGVSNSISDIQGIDDSSISTATIDYYHQEIDRLKKLLAEERKNSETAENKHRQVCAKLEAKETEMAKIQYQLDGMRQVYELEKVEKEQKEKRLQQLEKSQKGIQELKAEIQRLKDENGALIRVVGKLSRAPFTS